MKSSVARCAGLIVVVLVLAVIPGGELGTARLVTETSAPLQRGDRLAFHMAGRLADTSPRPSHFLFTGQLRSLATGEVTGSMTHEATCLGAVAVPCPVLDVTNTFNLPGGTLVNRALESVALDPQHAGFALIGIHPEGKSIASGTGVYAGRTGRAQMSGRHDGRELPEYVTFDDLWLIELDPR